MYKIKKVEATYKKGYLRERSYTKSGLINTITPNNKDFLNANLETRTMKQSDAMKKQK